MPKKKKCGKNTKSNKVHNIEKRKLIEADSDGQVYGLVEKVLGDRYFDVKCVDGMKRRCRVRSKRLKIQTQECVIVALRDFDPNNGDIIYKYNPDEVRELQKNNILPSVNIFGTVREDGPEKEDEEDGFIFEDI